MIEIGKGNLEKDKERDREFGEGVQTKKLSPPTPPKILNKTIKLTNR
jgi:hypothetical protein